MKKVVSFLRENPLFVVFALVAVVLYFIDDTASAGTLLAAVNAVSGGTPKPSSGIGGLPTQGIGEATTVSNASELGSDLIEADVSLIPSNARFAVRCV